MKILFVAQKNEPSGRNMACSTPYGGDADFLRLKGVITHPVKTITAPIKSGPLVVAWR